MARLCSSSWSGFLYRHGRALFIVMAWLSLSSWPGFVYRHGRALFIVMAGLDPAILARWLLTGTPSFATWG
jgi:hypothetical protein